MKAIKEQEKRCRICNTILVEDSKSGLCPRCVNKYGTPVAAGGVLALFFAAKKYGKTISKGIRLAVNTIHRK